MDQRRRSVPRLETLQRRALLSIDGPWAPWPLQPPAAAPVEPAGPVGPPPPSILLDTNPFRGITYPLPIMYIFTRSTTVGPVAPEDIGNQP
jgi:hypothetical protein